MTPTRALYLMALVLTVGGVVLRVVPLQQPGISTRPSAVRTPRHAVATPTQSATGEVGSAATDPVIAANIFARARVAPFRASAAHAAIARGPVATAPHTAAFTLYGTTIGPQGAVALIDDNSPPRGAHVHYMGDLIGGARLVAITDSTVTLDRESGPLILHLPPSARQTP